MLILSRGKDEQICIGEDVVVTVVRIENGKVRLGIRAPEGTSVDRKEVRDRIAAGETPLRARRGWDRKAPPEGGA
jgi:carbon storage regulator